MDTEGPLQQRGRAMPGQRNYVGVGLYTVPEAARIIRVKPSLLSRWIRAYTYQAGGRHYLHSPIVERYFDQDQRTLVFLELVELLFVKVFRDHNVSMQTIRRAAAAAADLFQTPYPFAVRRFDTDGKRIFATLIEHVGRGTVVEDLSQGQIVFEAFVRPFFHKIDYLGDLEALRYWPMLPEGRVVVDPHRSFGQPIDAETGIPTKSLYEAFIAAGRDATAASRWYDVPRAAVERAVEFESALLAA